MLGPQLLASRDVASSLREGLQVALECGAEALAGRAHEELVAAGARPRRDPTESRSKLTASERRVTHMAAEGMTNREIAQALFVTENTIETHLRTAAAQTGPEHRRLYPQASSAPTGTAGPRGATHRGRAP